MKLDPGMHIGLHLVFFGKTGVTRSLAPRSRTPDGSVAARPRGVAGSLVVTGRGVRRGACGWNWLAAAVCD
jgi:hypothetical protein